MRKFQITNDKSQTILKFKIPSIKPIWNLVINYLNLFVFWCLVLVIFLLAIPYTLYPVHAQTESVDFVNVYQINDPQAISGDIMVFDDKQGLVRANLSYNQRIFGILVDSSVLVFREVNSKKKPMAREGTAQVNVTTLNGPIRAGDFITSSEIPGKGQKATQSGNVIGLSISSFDEKSAQQIDYTPSFAGGQKRKISSGKVTVALRVEYAEISSARSPLRLLEYFNAALLRNVQNPEQFLQLIRYLGAALVVIIAFLISFITFSRSIPKSVEAIGRNPLASKAILFSIVLNILFTLLIGSVGLIAAFIILRL